MIAKEFTQTALALIWLTNGLYCKVLNLVPRHQEIVAAILGPAHARELTVTTPGRRRAYRSAWCC
ncbi:hypothetical protein [Neolewinella sp.]|uniref:hypothetical protein n=1 Tax=Neolewinella sp. TaxID=2993543 RepID=UPI003B520888